MRRLLKISNFVWAEEQAQVLAVVVVMVAPGVALEQADDGSLRAGVDGLLQLFVEEALASLSVAADSAQALDEGAGGGEGAHDE